jgi:hypothetical protein
MLWCTFNDQYPFNFLDSLELFGTYQDWLMGGPRLSEIPDLVKRWESAASRVHPGWPVYSAIRAEDYRKDGLLGCSVTLQCRMRREPIPNGQKTETTRDQR